MDERHWWLAGKVQQAVDNASEESSAALEAFFLEADNLQLVNRFLQDGGHQAMFFMVEANDKINPSTWKFQVKSDLQSLESVNLKTSFPILLYFLRFEKNHDVDAGLMEKDILCGEIKENPVESLRCLLNELYIPLLRAQKDWGSCNQENVASFLSGLEKYVSSIDEAATVTNLEKHHITILKRPLNIVSPDFLLQRSAALDPEIVSESETLISEWIRTIDQVLMEAVDERVLDITTSPLTELDRWHHRQKILGLITEQLRGKECKSVIGIMISTKSRLLKRWKFIDISITEAMNATKDRVKYLEALHRHFDALNTENDPENLINGILPGFFNGIQQMEILSRHFSKNGYLGLLLTKVSNQLALNCKSFLKEMISTEDSNDRLWKVIKEDIMKNRKEKLSMCGVREERILKKEKLKVKVQKIDSGFYERIQACLAIYTCFQEKVQHLREWLLGAHGLQRYSSLSSVSTAPGRLSSLQTSKTNKSNARVTASVLSSSDQQHDCQSSGVAITDDVTIMYHLEALSVKLKQTLDIVDKLQQFNILSKQTEGLRKPAPEDLMEDEDVESGSVFDSVLLDDPRESVDAQTEPPSYLPQIIQQITSTPGKLQTLIEEDEPQMFVEDSSILSIPSVKCGDSSTKSALDLRNDQLSPNNDEDREIGLSNEEKHMLDFPITDIVDNWCSESFMETSNLYNREDVDDDDCTLSSVLLEKLEQMIELLRQYIDADILLDTERRDHDPFEEGYSEFLVMNQQIENYISVYIQALFLRQIPCKDALSIIQRFSVVSHRQGIQHIVNECYVEVFDWFYLDLKDVQKEYETFKEDPVLPRNMPHAVGAVVWSRKLMSRIENTMKAFNNVQIVATCLTYLDTVKLYNKIASALLSYEDLWYQRWKSQIDKSLNGLNLTLLVRDPVTLQLMVNTDMRILQLIEETKWMLRLGIHVPEAALLAFHQAEKFKLYRSSLEDVVKEYRRIQQEIPEEFAALFSDHLEQVNHQFQPGMSTLSWSSVNIEGFLHQTSAAVKRLQTIVTKVREVKELVIEKILEEISYLDMIPMDEITSAPKNPDELLQLMQISLITNKTKVETMGCLIKSGYEDILTILRMFQSKSKLMSKQPLKYNCRSKHCGSWKSVQGPDKRFKLSLKFQIPQILIDPSIDEAEAALHQVVLSITDVSSCLNWWSGENKGQSFHVHMATDELLQYITTKVVESVRDLRSVVKKHVFSLSCYNFLWADNMYQQSQEFLDSAPNLAAMHKEVKHFLKIEEQIKEYSEVLQLGCISLDCSLIKETLKGFVGSWKSHYAAILHHHVKEELIHVVQYREETWQKLTMPVESLEQLNSILTLLEELENMENKIDELYQPIESTYEQLRSYQLRIPRGEVNDVTSLRNKWAELMDLTNVVKDDLLKEKQDIFKQELDKQVKSFVVEVIQFRNRFDTQGPAAPGVRPEEAVTRLHDFNEKYQAFDAKRKTLNSVQKLFNIVPKKFYELDKTGKDLELLGTLYILFQKFIEFDQRFRNTLWADVRLQISNAEIKQYSSECQIWNDKLKDWDAYNEMAQDIKFYEDVFPILHELKSKEIRNRHWLQVMSVTGSSFPLEANVFKVFHLLDIGLLKFQKQLISIAKVAKKEMDLEIKMRKVEEEWSEQVLSFKPYKTKVLLVKDQTLILLEALEDAHMLLAQMLSSKEIDPLREEATTWAEKLKRVGDILELWIDVQELWQHLEEVYNNPTTIQELPRDARRFAKVNRRWTLMMVSAYKTKNVLQCCCTGDVPKEVLLRHFYQELEICFYALNSYLGRMRQTFPRFYFLSDLSLVSVLSRPYDTKYLHHHLRNLFGGVSSIEVEKVEEEESEISDAEEVEVTGPVLDFLSVRSGNEGWLSTVQRSTTHVTDTESIFQRSLKSAGISRNQERNRAIEYKEPCLKINAVAVRGYAEECLQLDEQVSLTSSLGTWLSKLHSSLRNSLNNKICGIVEDINQGMAIEEWTQKYPTQAAILGLLYLWTRDFECSISETNRDRKAQSRILKKYTAIVVKLSTITAKGYWKNMEDVISQSQRLKLENINMQALYLRDVMENIWSRKVCENSDFEWKKSIKFYLKEKDGSCRHELNILDAQYTYGCEFYGAKIPFIMNPVTEKCFFKISQILQQNNGVILQGEHGAGKTETVKGLSYLLGNFLYVFTCCSVTNASALSRVINGTGLDGCWSCFDDVHLLPEDAVSVFMHSSQSLYESLQAKLPQITLQDGSQIDVQPTCSIFVTVSKSGFQNLPKDMLAIFRAVSFVFPDHTILLKAKLTSLGFKGPKALAKRLQLTSDLLKEQLPEDYHCHFSLRSMLEVIYRAIQRREMIKMISMENEGGSVSRSSSVMSYQQFTAFATSPVPSLKTGNSADRNKKVISSNPALAAAKESHALIADSLQDVIGPRMNGDNFLVFKQIVGDVFPGMYDPSDTRQILQKEIERAILLKSEESKLFPHSPWLSKVKQLFNLCLVNSGVIVAGPPASGKSSCISILIQALNHIQVCSGEASHKIVKIHPLSVDTSTLMFGGQNASRMWQDGVISYLWKKAIRNRCNSWLWLDGHLNSSWADNFNSVLGPEKVLQLNNGDYLELPENLKLIFETTDLQTASPTTLTKAGVLYIEGDALGWRPLSKIWLDGRNQQENAVLSKAFYRTLDPIFNLILHDTKAIVPVTEVGLFHSFTNLLTVLLNDKAQSIGGQLHIERLFIFCLIWSVGSLIEYSDRKKFSDLLKVYTSVLPDDDQEISVFDYFLDESGEWDTWQSRLPDITYVGNTDIMGETFIETQDTVIVRTFLEFASMGFQHVLLAGPPGCGKTALMNDFISTQDRTRTLLKRMVFSGSSKAKELQELLEQNIVHRQGFIYGAKDGKTLQLFIDDLHLPTPDENGIQHCNELLRLLLDDKTLVRFNKPFEWQTLEGLLVKAVMGQPKYANSAHRVSVQRLLRHFSIFHLPDLEGAQLQKVIFSVLEANMGDKDGLSLQEDLNLSLAKASCHLLESVKKVFVISPTPGRQHYLFSLREITKVFQSLRKLSNEDREDQCTVVAYWEHEMNRVIRDRLCRQADISWFKSELTTTITESFPDITTSALQKLYTTIPLEMKFSHQAGTDSRDVKVLLQSREKLDEVQSFLGTIVQHYNEELGHQKLHIELSENVVIQVIRIHRVLSGENGGNALLVGCVGSHLSTLVKLALYVADIRLHTLDISGKNSLMSSLKSAIEISAVEGKPTAILCNAEELATEGCLNAINSLLTCGEYLPLFTTEEMNDLLQVLGPALLRKHPHLGYDPTKYFISQVKSYLRIIVCISPCHELLQTASGKYPGFLSGCQLIWIDSWSQDVINREAKHYIMQHRIMETHTEETRENVATAMTLIHSSMLHDNDQIPWTGISHGSILSKKANESSQSNGALGDGGPAQFPYCKDITQEKLKLLLTKDTVMTDKVFVGPSTLQLFLDNFKSIFLKKMEEQLNTNNRLMHALETLANTRMDARKTQESIGGLEEKCKESQIVVSNILDKLITKTSMLEQLKAILGIGDETLQIFLSQSENEFDHFDEKDDLLKDDGCDDYDEAFYRMKEANKHSYLNDIQQKTEKAADELEELKKNQRAIKNEVMHWCSKVDKSCVERLVRCQNPPYLVAQILEMALVMISCFSKAENMNDLQKMSSVNEKSESRANTRLQPSPVSKPSPSKRGIRESTDKVDRARWKNIQYKIGETSKFVEMIHQIARLEDGLPDQTLKDVEAYLGKAKEGSHGVTGEGSLLENAAPNATPQSITPAKKYSHIDSKKNKDAKGGGITIATARYSSEDAASLVAFVVAIIEYTRLCAPVKECQKKLSNIEKEKEDLILKEAHLSRIAGKNFEEEPTVLYHQTLSALTADDLPLLQKEITQLHEEYDAAVNLKHQVEEKLESHKEKLQAAANMLNRLKMQEQEWKEKLNQSSVSDLLTNCVLAAAFVTYCPALSMDRRSKVTSLLFKVCESCGLHLPHRTLLKNLPLIQLMQTPIEIKTLEERGLPTNPLALNNSCIFSSTMGSNSWVLVCDPTGQAIDWIKGHLPEDTVEVMYNALLSEMDTCLTIGHSLLLTYCEMQDLSCDARFKQILRSKREFFQHHVPFKMMVGEHEVECHPSFRIYLHTTKMPEDVPPEVASFCTTLYFYQDREGLVEQLLDRFVSLEKPRLKEEHVQLKQEGLANMIIRSTLEEKVIVTLQSHESLLHSLSVTKKLGDFTLQHEEASEMYMKTVAAENSMLLARGDFREIAVRGAVMFDTSRMLQQLNKMYNTSYKQLLQLFDASVAHSERYSLKGIVASVTSNIFSFISRSLLDKDRLVYALLLAFEVQDSLGRLSPGEREFIISPVLCVTVLQGRNSKMLESRQQEKNPFDWMSEEQFKNVQALATCFDWFGDLFDRMCKDVKDLTWKTFCESEQPENPSKVKWPEGIEALSPLQKFMVLRAVRKDRILPSASNYISAALGKTYTSDVATDLQATLSWMSPHEPGLLLYGTDSKLPRTILESFAEANNQKITVFPIGFSEDKTKDVLTQVMSEGCWMLMENIHNSPKLMMSLGEILKSKKNPEKNFRLWLSAQAREDLPTSLLHYTVKTVVDTPMNIRRGIIRSWKFVNHEVLATSSRPEWPPLLHNLCFLHGAIRFRTLYGGGWNCPDAMTFGCAELMESIEILKREFKEDSENARKIPSWTALRYLLSEIIYGCNVSDDFDMTVLTSMIDYWISINTTKKDSELTKLKFRIPSSFFNLDLNPASLAQAMELIPQYSLDAPEAFHMHPSPVVQFGEQGYIISKLCQMYGYKEGFCRHGEKPFQTSQKGVKLSSFQSPRSSSLKMPEILPRSAEIAMPRLSELHDICASMLSKLPRGWSRDFINDRLKKLGGDTPFNLFLKKELGHLMALVSEIRNNLQMIKNSLESSEILGDQLSDSDIGTIVHELYHKKPPSHWCNMAWNFSCPSDWSVSYFLQDLQQRVSHFEKLLQLGREKMPIYWLGAFRNPKGLLSVLKQEAIRRYTERTENVDSIELTTEITQRDKEHIRDPPQEGIFVHGVHLWGVNWNKTDGEIVDSPPKHCLNVLPVIHLQCLPTSEKSGIHDTYKSDTYQCPVYCSSTSIREPVFNLDIHKENVSCSRWALRGMKATIHPF
ncbi:uncharacterized protein [Dendrobates tinctorius]|uniref:uncharacterized protein n=1 Tax=Dendrobates tinctorius TaxID=92724 RepID=UPI003CCA48A6